MDEWMKRLGTLDAFLQRTMRDSCFAPDPYFVSKQFTRACRRACASRRKLGNDAMLRRRHSDGNFIAKVICGIKAGYHVHRLRRGGYVIDLREPGRKCIA